jgi:hypothetical protein
VAVGIALVALGRVLEEQAVVATAGLVALVATQQMVLAVAEVVAMPPTRMAVEEVTG